MGTFTTKEQINLLKIEPKIVCCPVVAQTLIV